MRMIPLTYRSRHFRTRLASAGQRATARPLRCTDNAPTPRRTPLACTSASLRRGQQPPVRSTCASDSTQQQQQQPQTRPHTRNNVMHKPDAQPLEK